MKLHLRGEARIKFDGLAERDKLNYTRLKGLMVAALRPPNFEILATAEFLQMAQKCGESIEAYAYRFRKCLANSLLQRLSTEEVVEAFVRGTSFGVKEYLMSQHPRTIERAIELGNEYIRVSGPTQPTSIFAINSAVVCAMCAQHGHIGVNCPKLINLLSKNKSVESAETEESINMVSNRNLEPKKASSAELKCYGCGESGHMVRKCPKFNIRLVCDRCKNRGHLAVDCALLNQLN